MMDLFYESFSKGNTENSELKIMNNPSVLSNKIVCESKESSKSPQDNKSICTIKKINSFDRISFRVSTTTKVESLNKSNEKLAKPVKSSRMLQSSSTTLDIYNTQNDYISKLSFALEPKIIKPRNELFLSDLLGMKKQALYNFIKENPNIADLKWSLFCAACHSYRFDSVLRPFPPMFVNGDMKDIDRLREVAESCPSIKILYNQFQEKTSELISVELVNLLYWVLIHVREPTLKFIPKDKHTNILSKVMSTCNATTPEYIFQVFYNKEPEREKFNELAKYHNTIHAFHGSRLDNFYSILNYGLRISFNKISAYGPGIYLSSEINVSLPYSQTGFTWGGSCFGSEISIVALCEVIDHPDVKSSQHQIYDNNKNKYLLNLGSIPQKYFIVQTSELVRVKYLLIYTNNVFPQTAPNHLSTVITWFQKNKVIAIILAYVILLMAIATSNNSVLYKYYKRVLRKIKFT